MNVIRLLLASMLLIVAIGLFGLAAVTMLPIEVLPWHMHHLNCLGYASGCAFAPFSTALLATPGLLLLGLSARTARAGRT